MSSPTTRSLVYIRNQGYIASITERWNPFAHIRQDLFNFIDIIGFNIERKEFVGIQTTSQSNVSARIEKVKGISDALHWLQAGGKIYVHGWALKGKAGTRKTWKVTVREITLKDFNR